MNRIFLHRNKETGSQWPSGLRRGSAADRFQGLRVRIPPGGMDVCESCECCVLSGRVLCDGPITRSEEYYRLWCVIVCDPKTSRMRRPWPALGCSATEKKNKETATLFIVLAVYASPVLRRVQLEFCLYCTRL